MIYARLGQQQAAEKKLRRALELEPASAAVNFNLGLLMGEQGSLPEAESLLRAALRADPDMAEAAFNLGVLLASDRISEAIQWCRKAAQGRPNEPKYSYTLAFFLNQNRQTAEALGILEQLISRHPSFVDGYALLGAVYESQGRGGDAREVYRQALALSRLNPSERHHFEAKLRE
jgi:predicted Zn-dependent protease